MENTEFPNRKINRLKDWDYSSNGGYFITICTNDKMHLFGTICVGGGALDAPIVELSAFGKIVENEIIRMNDIYDNIIVTDYVIMPNHIHFILMIKGRSGAPAPTRANAIIPQYISTLKRFTNKKCNSDLWQRSYYDHIICNEADYVEKRNYIQTNPAKWLCDEYYSD